MKIIFKAAEGAPFGNLAAQIIGEQIKLIEKKFGEVTPEIIVDEARNPKNLLHNYFEWDNNIGAEKWRRQQARNIINHLIVIREYKGNEKEIKAYFSVMINEKEKRYVSIEAVLKSKDFREQIISEALREIIYWKEKYKDYQELGLIFEAVEKTQKDLQFKKSKKEVVNQVSV